ncbi:hypothetical protein [Lysinibacillus sp. TE18511]
MNKRIISLLFLSCLLFACEDQQANTADVLDHNESTKDDKLTYTMEEWKQQALESTWYQNVTIPSEESYVEMIDFEGDEVPELFIGYNGTNYGYIIGQYNSESKAWEQWISQQYEATIHGDIRFKGIFKGKDKKDIALITKFTAGASDNLEVLHLLKVADDGNDIISGQSYRLYADSDLKVDTSKNVFTIQTGDFSEHFTLRDHTVTSEYRTSNLYSGLPIIQNPKLLKLLNHDFFKTNIIFGDTYPVAKEKSGLPKKEDYYEGGLCSFYNDYFFCLAEDEIPVSHYYLSNFKNVTKESLEEVINQAIHISSYERYENPDDIVYYANFEFENVYFQAEFNHDQSNAELTSLTLGINASE